MNLDQWLEEFVERMKNTFGSRLLLIGIQGSVARNEAGSESDIDVVVLLDRVDFKDLEKYKAELALMSNRDRICGFISGKDEILCWEKPDLFHFYYDTVSLYGNMDFLQSIFQRSDIRRAILTGACNIYHTCSHNFLHENDFSILTNLYKGIFFVLRAISFYETGTFYRSRKELISHLSSQDRDLMDRYEILKNRNLENRKENDLLFANASENLLSWSSELIHRYTI